MKFFLLLITLTFIAGCSAGNDCCVNIDTGVSIKYLNEEGENLFKVDGGLEISDINIYHKINNEWVGFYQGNLDSPKGISLEEREEEIYLVIFPSTTIVANGYSETKIEFSESDSDILKTEIYKMNSNEIVTKVWYNNVLKWDGNETERIIEVIK